MTRINKWAMQRVEDCNTSSELIGTFSWHEHLSPATPGVRWIKIRLDDSNAPLTCLPVYRAGSPAPDIGMPAWEWDGNEDAPTLSPSILHHSEPPFHGFVRAGWLDRA